LLANTENLLNFNKEFVKNLNSGQVSLFADSKEEKAFNQVQLKDHPPANRQDKLSWEKELLGLYITAHPFSDYKKKLSEFVRPIRDILASKNDQQINVAGIVVKVQKIMTRTNKTMLFVKIEDDTGGIEVLVFPNLYKTTSDIWQSGKAVICQGKLSDKDQELKLLANTATKVSLRKIDEVVSKFHKAEFGNQAMQMSNKNIHVLLEDIKIVFKEGVTAHTINTIKEILSKHKGGNKVFFEISQNGEKRTLETDILISNNSFLITELKGRMGGLITVEKLAIKN